MAVDVYLNTYTNKRAFKYYISTFGGEWGVEDMTRNAYIVYKHFLYNTCMLPNFFTGKLWK